MIIENSHYLVEFANGKIIGFYDLETNRNLAARNGICGTACFTLKSDDIRTLPHEPFESYADRTGKYDSVEFLGENAVVCRDTENKIITNCRMDETGLVLTSETDNPEISEFGLNLDLNFMGKKGTDYHSQLLPTSPYTSADGSHMYCLMTCPNGRFLIAAAQTVCDGWRIKYSPYSAGHYIQNFQILASFDQVYGGSGRKKLQIRLQCADSLESAFRQIQHIYQVPLCRNLLSGGFDGYAFVKAYGKADAFQVSAPDGHIYQMKPGEKITLTEFGLHTVTPICQGVPGLNTTVWNGGDMISLFDKSCDAIQKPYHTDDNLCEGGCFLWAMLVNMRLHNSRKYDAVVREELDIIMGKRKPVPRRTILPYPADGYPAWHIFQSNRVQEQFFGVSILLEAYKLYQRPELLEYATAALQELVADHMKDGMVYNGEDYTTVCCPMIPLVDMANYLKAAGDDRAEQFETAAEQMAAFLYKRGFHFPTEGTVSEWNEPEMEDGSISCTALALLYFCARFRKDETYAEFAGQILELHRAWTIYTPDARMQDSSFRWWETIWEGDGEGPAICAGHAWTIWKAEALFYYGILFREDQALLDSWNGFITNLSKTQADGTMYSCYEADYIRGGGDRGIKATLKQLAGENIDTKYVIAHGYPDHPDHSLSRYAWVRASETWLKTAAILCIEGEIISINIKKVNDMWRAKDEIEYLYVSPALDVSNIYLDDPRIKIIADSSD